MWSCDLTIFVYWAVLVYVFSFFRLVVFSVLHGFCESVSVCLFFVHVLLCSCLSYGPSCLIQMNEYFPNILWRKCLWSYSFWNIQRGLYYSSDPWRSSDFTSLTSLSILTFSSRQADAMFDVAVACPAGTFFNVISENCEDCQRGTYQPDEGQLTCLVCPNNTSTSRNSSKSIQQCQGMCLCVSSVCLSVWLSLCTPVCLYISM